MKRIIQGFLNEKSLAGVRSLGVGVALAGSVAVFFGQSMASAFLALAVGLVILLAASYTKPAEPAGGNDV